jgi:hypothetical protein
MCLSLGGSHWRHAIDQWWTLVCYQAVGIDPWVVYLNAIRIVKVALDHLHFLGGLCKLCDSIKKNELTAPEIARAFIETCDDEDDLHNRDLWAIMENSGKMDQIEEEIWKMSDIDLEDEGY